MLVKLQQQNKWLVFTTISLIAIYFTWLMNAALPFEKMLFNSFYEQVSINRIKSMMYSREKWQWIGYAIVPLVLIIKWFLVAIVLDVGALLLEVKLKFKKAFQIAMLSEVVFLVLVAVKFGWFFYNRDILTLEYVQSFMPLSVTNLTNMNSIDKWFIYPLQILNLFEVSYWLLLAYFLSTALKKTFGKALQFVAITYGSGLVIWVVFIAFLTLSFS